MAEVNQHIFFRALGTTHRVVSKPLHGSAAIVEHTVEPMSLGAPMHKHTHEDEISYVLEGELSVIQEGVKQVARSGEFIVKPRGMWHTFWNATPHRIRFLEIIVPGNFEGYYAAIAPFLPSGQPPQSEKLKEVAVKYGLLVDPQATETLIKEEGLKSL